MKALNRILLIMSLAIGLTTCNTADSLSKLIEIESRGIISEKQILNVQEVFLEHGPSILDKLEVLDMPNVKVIIWQNRSDFALEFGGDATNVRGFINSDKSEVHVINTRSLVGFGAFHEYVHLVSRRANLSNSMLPIWLWESIAIFESRRPPPPPVTDLKCIDDSTISSLADLNAHPSNIYRVGYYLSEFILSEWSYPGMANLLRNGGDVSSTFGVAESEFEELWLEYMKNTYPIILQNRLSSNQC